MTVQWPLILAGGLLVVLFLLLPKLMVKHRHSWWVRVLQGKPMVPVAVPTDDQMKGTQCGWCGKPEEREER